MLLDPRNGPEWDLRPVQLPRRIFLVASTPRTGSTLLCRSLWDTGLVGAPKEYLNPMQIRDWEVRLGTPLSAARHRLLSGPVLALAGKVTWDPERVDHHMQRVMARRTGSNGWFGMKLHAHHHRQWFGGRPIEEALGASVQWIRIVREDRLAQAVSWDRALQTGRWASHQQRPWIGARYRRRGIEARLAAIDRDEAWWDAALRDQAVLTLTYDRVRRGRAAVIRRVLEHLGVDGGGGLGVHDAPLERQADATSARWMERFRAGD